MASLAERAAQLAQGFSFQNPVEAIQYILPELHRFGCQITGRRDLKRTFTLNSLVAIDLALWKLYALEQGSLGFSELIPEEYRFAFQHRQSCLAHAPLITYNVPVSEVIQLVDRRHFFLKIKIGQQGSQEEMLEKDKTRLSELHVALKHKRTSHTADGKLLYYLDANGRYQDKEGLIELLNHAEAIGMLEQIALLEEPFPYEKKISVTDLPVRVAADESLHAVKDLQERINLGYRAFALKPAGRTLSMSITMAAAAAKHDIPCFVADSACVPLLVEWNKITAAHLSSFPELSMGVLESNGAQNYRNWQGLLKEHSRFGAPWIEPREGLFVLDQDFYDVSGGIFDAAGHYEKSSDEC